MPTPPTLLITGATGRLGRALVQHLGGRFTLLTPTRAELDFEKEGSFTAWLAGKTFDAAIHTAAWSSPDPCEIKPELAERVNVQAPQTLASHCHHIGARLIHISTDYVFAGDTQTPLQETDPAQPLSHYGRTKRAAEIAVLSACPSALVARVSWLFGLDKPCFPDSILQKAMSGEIIQAINDKWSTPTHCEDLACWLETLLTSHRHVTGLLHLCNSGQATWKEYAEETLRAAERLGLPLQSSTVVGHTMHGFAPFIAPRPAYTVMDNRRWQNLSPTPVRTWQEALQEYVAQWKKQHAQPSENTSTCDTFS